MTGVLIVILIILLAGGIAYIGDRVGHQVGRKRLTLFGLRPKYTSTIVAVATGMAIAFVVVVGALIASNLVRTAFFRLGSINARINELQTQQLNEENELKQTRGGTFSVPRGALLANAGWSFDLSQSDQSQLPAFSKFFDSAVAVANQQFANPRYGLLPYKNRSSDARVHELLIKQLADSRSRAKEATRIVFLLPVAFQNLFRGETIVPTFQSYDDVKLANAGETIASVVVNGGTSPVTIDAAIDQLLNAARGEMARRVYPAQFLVVNLTNSTQLKTISSQLPRLHGGYRLVAKAPIDLYPHSGYLPLDFALEPVH